MVSPQIAEPTNFATETARPRSALAELGAPRSGLAVRGQNGEQTFPTGKPISGWVSLGAPGPVLTSGSSPANPAKEGEPFPPAPRSRTTRQVRYDDSPEERFNRGVVAGGDPLLGPGGPSPSRSHRSSRFGDGWLPFVNNDTKGCDAASAHTWFQSDSVFRNFVSPITNPFLFEDPRSETNVRPIFIFQKMPSSNPLFQGGQSYFFGARASLALTENLSLTLNKIGGVLFNPGSGSPIGTEGGFAEIWLGPKLTFWRDDQSNLVAAAGAIFQIPAGSSNAFQDTGKLSVVPYATVAKNFFGASTFGGINLIDTVGYAFSLGGGRSDYLYNSFHIDYDVGNQHRIYPLAELNWFHYTKAGGERPFTVEGLDLANIGAFEVAEKDFLSVAGGLRYRFNERTTIGGAIEFPLLKQHDAYDYRLTVDFIWRF